MRPDFASRLHRRGFLLSTAAGISAATAWPALAQPKPQDASQVVPGKDKRLILHAPGPVQLETPPELLDADETPLDRLFVRNNQLFEHAASLEPLPPQGWKIELAGLIDKPLSIDATQLADMEQVEHAVVLQCCGNGRSLYARAAAAKGTQWTRGGMGNVRFAGVPLSAVLEKHGVRTAPRARYVTAEGKDEALPDKEDFEHSLPLDDVLERSLLALRINGRPLPAVHGGPVRLVTPGFYGTMHVKWLTRLRFEADESDNYNHIPRYRTPNRPIKPGEAIEYTFANSTASWRMKIKTVVLSPAPGDTVPAGRNLEVRGVAFNDGAARIDSVLLSLNRGRTWRRTRLQRPESPYAWYRWTARVTLPAGQQEIWTRAVDALGRSQPLDGTIAWNPSGYEWNGVEKISLHAV